MEQGTPILVRHAAECFVRVNPLQYRHEAREGVGSAEAGDGGLKIFPAKLNRECWMPNKLRQKIKAVDDQSKQSINSTGY